jgi:hypothetical protein
LVSYDERRIPFDLLVTVPLNLGTGYVAGSGLGNEMNYVPVDAGRRICFTFWGFDMITKSRMHELGFTMLGNTATHMDGRGRPSGNPSALALAGRSGIYHPDHPHWSVRPFYRGVGSFQD